MESEKTPPPTDNPLLNWTSPSAENPERVADPVNDRVDIRDRKLTETSVPTSRADLADNDSEYPGPSTDSPDMQRVREAESLPMHASDRTDRDPALAEPETKPVPVSR